MGCCSRLLNTDMNVPWVTEDLVSRSRPNAGEFGHGSAFQWPDCHLRDFSSIMSMHRSCTSGSLIYIIGAYAKKTRQIVTQASLVDSGPRDVEPSLEEIVPCELPSAMAFGLCIIGQIRYHKYPITQIYRDHQRDHYVSPYHCSMTKKQAHPAYQMMVSWSTKAVPLL